MKRMFLFLSIISLISGSLTALDNYFTVLGISPIATPAQVDAGYQAKRLGLIPDPLTVNEEDVADELALLDTAYQTLKSPADRRYYAYTLLINGAEGRAPNLFAQTPRLARILAQQFFDATRTIGSNISLIDSNKNVEKAYDRQYRLLGKTKTGAELERKRAELERAKDLLTQPWRMLELVPADFKDQVDTYIQEYGS